jgi:hypothetical protein
MKIYKITRNQKKAVSCVLFSKQLHTQNLHLKVQNVLPKMEQISSFACIMHAYMHARVHTQEDTVPCKICFPRWRWQDCSCLRWILQPRRWRKAAIQTKHTIVRHHDKLMFGSGFFKDTHINTWSSHACLLHVCMCIHKYIFNYIFFATLNSRHTSTAKTSTSNITHLVIVCNYIHVYMNISSFSSFMVIS